MKCPRCGADSTVRETRPYAGLFTRRVRDCFNEHRFVSFEVTPAAVDWRAVATVQRGVVARRKADRLRAAVARQPGVSGEALGRALGVSGQRVRQIRREQNA